MVIANGTRYNPDAVISSQFLGKLILPEVHVAGLQLNPKRVDSVELINGSSKVVYVHTLGDSIVIGVGLLFLNTLRAYFAEDSRFTLEP